MESMLKFLIVDDQKIIREALAEKLVFFFNDGVVKTVSSGIEGLALLDNFDPDVIFMDISMPVMDGIEATRIILSRYPEQRIIAFSMNDNDEMLNKMLKAGAKGYLLKTDDLQDFREAIDTVLKDELFISKNVMKQ